MAISVKEAAVLFALAESQNNGDKVVAIRFESSGKIAGIGINDSRSEFDSRSAIINVLQNTKSRKAKFIACSHSPDERSLGMCLMQDIKLILFPGEKSPLAPQVALNRQILSAEPTPKKNFNPHWGFTTFERDRDETQAGLPDPNKGELAKDWLERLKAAPNKSSLKMLSNYEGAQRVRHFQESPVLSVPPGLPKPDGGRVDNPLRHEIFLKLAWAVVGEASTRREPNGPYPKGHNIGSVLRGPNDEILAWGINTGKKHFSLHGEVNLIQNYHKQIEGKAIGENDADAKKPILYSTLEPCYMCAGIYANSGEKLKCVFSQDDPGILFNSLAQQFRHSQQDFVDEISDISKNANRMGRLAGSAYGYEERRLVREKARNKKPAVTGMLNNKIDMAILYAIEDYFDLVPDKGTDARKTWDKVEEKSIWEAGLKLLHHINPAVKAKWEARTQKFTNGILE